MKIGNLKVITEHPSDYLRQILADYKRQNRSVVIPCRFESGPGDHEKDNQTKV